MCTNRTLNVHTHANVNSLYQCCSVVSRFQKIIQSDRLTIISLTKKIASLKINLRRMESSPLIGGFEQNLSNQMYWCSPNGKTFFKDIELLDVESHRETTSFSELRKKIIGALCGFVEERFETDDEFVRLIEPFVKFYQICHYSFKILPVIRMCTMD